jgi:glutathione synthase/RimK-type ligase-like ATP-grasp enzyme
LFIEKGDVRSLAEMVQASGWQECVLKPAVGGAGRHTYRLNVHNIAAQESLFRKLIAEEAFLLQDFMQQITVKGEVALMLFEGKFTHAVLKKAKAGDFRVQDDFGGTVHDYQPTQEEITFAEAVVRTCDPLPVYARVDVIWDNEDRLCVSELELIEPELWFRNCPVAAEAMADGIQRRILSGG